MQNKNNLVTESVKEFLDIMKTKDGAPIISTELLDWLIENGFFTAPASTKHHGDYEGGLFDHSVAVTRKLLQLTETLGLKWQRKESPYIIGMFHDLCKIDSYVKQTDNRNNVSYAWNDDMILNGHATKSIMLLSQFINLTEEELLCIRFHMGAYETDDWNSYGKSIEKYETVLWTHTADMYASRVEKV